ncbi:MAG: 3-dehydroquinate synthase [Chloroflexota bacterium]|nr:3-dehydroquinate synthase [Chloroflexota bacterium]
MCSFRRVVLTGFSGTGKSTVARLVARELGWRCLDLDEAIEKRFGQTVTAVFDDHGEAEFRRAEASELEEALSANSVVIATGGGAVVAPTAETRARLESDETFVVALDALPETILHRLREQQMQEGGAPLRPLLVGSEPIQRISELKCARQPAYDRADLSLVVDSISPDFLSAELTAIVRGDQPPDGGITLSAPSGESRILVSKESHLDVGRHVRRHWPRVQRAWVISDENVGRLYAPQLVNLLEREGVDGRVHHVPAGESSKCLSILATLYDWMLDGGIERGDVIVALGGGVVGDLAGFAAATCLRGVGLVQVPTTLLAMVDSSVGGKTGINHAAGKNLIGAFYQPSLVLIDPTFLRTLPARELTSGWAEVIKHALIQPSTPGGKRSDLVRFLQRNTAALLQVREPAISYLIQRMVALKSAVVSADEREAGPRALLNFGHTLGHAIEAAGFHYLHGEAIALGIRAAMRIGTEVGTCDPKRIAIVDALLTSFGLPTTATVDPELVIRLLNSDKKRLAGQQRWILPGDSGVVVRDDVPYATVISTLESLLPAPSRSLGA